MTLWKLGGLALLFVSAVGGFRYQQRLLEGQSQINQELNLENERLNQHLKKMNAQVKKLSLVLSEQRLQHQYLEKASGSARQQLQGLLSEDACANQFVPFDVIRLQHETFSKHTLYRGFNSGISINPLYSPGVQR